MATFYNDPEYTVSTVASASGASIAWDPSTILSAPYTTFAPTGYTSSYPADTLVNAAKSYLGHQDVYMEFKPTRDAIVYTVYAMIHGSKWRIDAEYGTAELETDSDGCAKHFIEFIASEIRTLWMAGPDHADMKRALNGE